MYNPPKYKRYVWELPLRWCHWTMALCIVVLSATGVFIGTPISLGMSPSDFTTGAIRFTHFVFGYVFTIALAARLIWAVVGNEHANWRAFFPALTPEGHHKFLRMLRYYLLLDKEVPETVGHNPLATTAYFVLFLIYLVMITTGFAMYASHAPGGPMYTLLGFMYSSFTLQGMRMTHHFCMWLIFGFIINHIYSAWLMDIKEHGGEISSMFSGYKFTLKKEE